MLATVYFLISLKDELNSISNYGVTRRLPELSKPALWMDSEPDKASLSRSERDMAIKILYTNDIYNRYSLLDDFKYIFPAFSMSVDFFDKYWNLSRASLDIPIEFIAKDLLNPSETQKEFLREVEKHGRVLDFYMNNILKNL